MAYRSERGVLRLDAARAGAALARARRLALLGGAGRLKRTAGGAVLVAVPLALLGAAAFGLEPSGQGLVVVFLAYVIAVTGIGIHTGNSGILSFAHAAFMALGACLAVLLAKAGIGLVPALLLAMVAAGALAWPVGLPLSRLGGAAGALATLAVLVVVLAALSGALALAGGAPIPRGVSHLATLPVALVGAVVAVFVARFWRDSVPGLRLRASREDARAARSVGVEVRRHRLSAWVVSAIVAAASGALLGAHVGAFDPADFSITLALGLLAMLVVGGAGTVAGAAVGTLLVLPLISLLLWLGGGPVIGSLDLPSVPGLTEIVLAMAILAMLFWRREGLLGAREPDEVLSARHALREHRQSPARPSHGPPPPDIAPRPRATGACLEARGLCKSHGGHGALEGVSIALYPGEIVGLVGSNGAGKTTLIDVLSGALAPARGRIVLDGTDVTGMPAEAMARRGVGRTFQTMRLFAGLSVLENVMVAAAPPGIAALRDPESVARQQLEELGLGAHAERLPGTLTSSARRRLGIARALALKPRYLLLDEPVAGMNQADMGELVAVLESIRARHGIGLLVADYDLNPIMELCDRVVALDRGRVIADGPPAELAREPAVIEAYLGVKRTAAGR